MKLYNAVNYKIFFDIDINTLKYTSIVEIELIILDNINELSLNSKDLEIKNLKINNIINNFIYDKTNNLLILKENFIKDQKYIIKIEFINIISDDLEGIYYSKEKEKDDVIICTQLEPDLARRVFP